MKSFYQLKAGQKWSCNIYGEVIAIWNDLDHLVQYLTNKYMRF